MCLVFSTNLSNTNNSDGNTVRTHNTPINTPLAITTPISNPSVNVIVHSAKNPAIVVKLDPSTDVNVSCIASSIAFVLSLLFSFLLSYL